MEDHFIVYVAPAGHNARDRKCNLCGYSRRWQTIGTVLLEAWGPDWKPAESPAEGHKYKNTCWWETCFRAQWIRWRFDGNPPPQRVRPLGLYCTPPAVTSAVFIFGPHFHVREGVTRGRMLFIGKRSILDAWWAFWMSGLSGHAFADKAWDEPVQWTWSITVAV